MTSTFLITVVDIFVGGLLITKIIEMFVCSTLPSIRKGRTWTQEFHEDYAANGAKIAVKNHLQRRYKAMIINEWIGKRLSIISNYIYRWPVLIISMSIMTVITSNIASPRNIVLCIIAVYVGLASEVIHEIVDRLALGVVSNVQFSTYVKVGTPSYAIASWTTSEILRRCSISLIIQLTTLWVGFSSIYYGLLTLQPNSLNNAKGIVDCVYFALVTLTTTGFGDVYPKTNTAKILVGSQIGMCWLFVVMMLFHYGSSMSFDLAGKD